jgi:hypothetical protein
MMHKVYQVAEKLSKNVIARSVFCDAAISQLLILWKPRLRNLSRASNEIASPLARNDGEGPSQRRQKDFFCALLGDSTKKIPSLLKDRGLISAINPHIVLTPKTVREHPGRSSGSPPSVSLPSPQGPVARIDRLHCLANSEAGITAAGPLPILTGFPSLGCDRNICGCFITQQTDKVKMNLVGFRYSAINVPHVI